MESNKELGRQETTLSKRKEKIKEGIAKVITSAVPLDKNFEIGFKEKLKHLMAPGTRKSSYNSNVKRIQDISEKMNELIVFFDEKMDNVLEKREKEFLSACA